MVVAVPYSVTTPAFEGPIDLLLHLISSHELDVLDIPLAPVVDAFVKELVEHRDTLSLDTLSEFLLVAAILVEMKSQKLLPGPDVVEDEDELVGWEERDLLLARLLECRAYAAAADAFVGLIEQASRSIPRESGLDDGFMVHAPDLLAGVSVESLSQAYLRATAERPTPRVDLSHVTVDSVTVAEAVEELVRQLPHQGTSSFRALTQHLTTRMEVIVHFLALLELCKLGRVELAQGHTFGDMDVAWVADRRELAPAGIGGSALIDHGDLDTYDG